MNATKGIWTAINKCLAPSAQGAKSHPEVRPLRIKQSHGVESNSGSGARVERGVVQRGLRLRNRRGDGLGGPNALPSRPAVVGALLRYGSTKRASFSVPFHLTHRS
jgi:hypothetical protein